MEAKELRIGNLFRFISTNFIEYVSDIKTNGLKTPVINNVSIKDTEPIPLTKEWLIKFGFEEALNGWWSPCEEYSYREGNFYLGANIFLAKIDYVHQLQNIYTVLQSIEL